MGETIPSHLVEVHRLANTIVSKNIEFLLSNPGCGGFEGRLRLGDDFLNIILPLLWKGEGGYIPSSLEEMNSDFRVSADLDLQSKGISLPEKAQPSERFKRFQGSSLEHGIPYNRRTASEFLISILSQITGYQIEMSEESVCERTRDLILFFYSNR